MLERGEYGEFFPPQFLVSPYRISLAAAYIGFDDFEIAASYGYDTSEIRRDPPPPAKKSLLAEDLPDDIRDVSDDIVGNIIVDGDDKQFKIIKPELAFYRTHNLPLPRQHPSTRMHSWYKELDLRYTFYERPCAQCGSIITTGYDPQRPEVVYCEECYQAALT